MPPDTPREADNGASAASVALQYALSNDTGLTAAKVSVTFRCLVAGPARSEPDDVDLLGSQRSVHMA